MREMCELCMHQITNPICANCYLKHARSWLRDFGLSDIEIKQALSKIKEKLPRETLNEHVCVICGKEQISICMYCAFLRSSKILLQHANNKSYQESSNFIQEEKDD